MKIHLNALQQAGDHAWLLASMAALLTIAVSLWNLLVEPDAVPTLRVAVTEEGRALRSQSFGVPCYDAATLEHLGTVAAMTQQQVQEKIEAACAAAEIWKQSSFRQRNLLMKTLLKYIIENQETICRVAAQDSGKPILDAAFGEVTVTCEKICWLLAEGERWLRPEHRSASRMMFYKSARVEFRPVGVVGAIVPWNYPFHNVFNPLTAALYAGNAIVIKVSEHASWSALYYGRIISAALEAVGAPPELVQIVTGYAEAGSALVTGGVDKLIFVGSTGVGRKVMAAAAESLTPVVLELGGKDPIIICDDADLDHATSIALRGTYQSSGQNCAGCERLLVQESVFDRCLEKLVKGALSLRQGAPLADPTDVDAGALALPGLAQTVQALVDDAVAAGAKVLVGGTTVHPDGCNGDFFAPTVLTGVTPAMRIWREEVFGPIMVVVPFANDAEAIALANDCAFGLGSAVFSGSQRRANAVAANLQVGMTTINDFATTYMCQSLPFGGVKHSGFDRFAGVEGLRGLCNVHSICQDRLPWLIRTDIPSMLQYPTKPAAFAFQTALVQMFYGVGLRSKLQGLVAVLRAVLQKPAKYKST